MSTTTPSLFPVYTQVWHTSPPPSISPTRPELSAAGKTIVITGGGTGIGASIALAFAQAGAAHIGLIARREEKLKSSAAEIRSVSPSTKVSYAIADTLDVPALTAAFQKLDTELGSIDVMVSNAGYLSTPATVLEADAKDWWRAIEVNVLGTFNTIRAFIPLAAKDAVLLNISTGIAHMPSNLEGVSAYAAGKVAGAKLVEYVSNELKESGKGVRVYNVQPGVVASEMNDKHGKVPPMDSPDLPANFCVWLASPEGKFLDGKFVWVNWDVDELKARAKEIAADPHELVLTLRGPTY